MTIPEKYQRADNIEYARMSKQKMIKIGRCVYCRKKKHDKNKSLCEECRESRKKYKQKKEKQNLLSGICSWCGKNKIIKGRVCCEICVLKAVSRQYLGYASRWHELLDLFNRQNGQCPYTGIKLRIGINASIDHIIPKSRGGSYDDINNLQWTDESINLMKYNLLHDEFIYACSVIAKRFKGTINADNVIQNYEWFKQQYNDYQAINTKIVDADSAVLRFKREAGDRTKWTFEDKNESSRLASILDGLKYQRADISGKYNARSKMLNRELFKTSDLPAELPQ